MKTITIQLDYKTTWGQNIYIQENFSKYASCNENKQISLHYVSDSLWSADVVIEDHIKKLIFTFIVDDGATIIRKESSQHVIYIPEQGNAIIKCRWQDTPLQKYLYSSMFTKSIFRQDYMEPSIEKLDGKFCLIVDCIHLEPKSELVICGNANELGAWQMEHSVPFTPLAFGKWIVQLDLSLSNSEYKFAVRNRESKLAEEWEDGENRCFSNIASNTIYELSFNKKWINWKESGVAIPIFSLRSHNSFGIGEFSDLPLLVDWAREAGLKVIQTLPINDTTTTYTWTDSYPYSAISIYALHPIYLGLYQYPLIDSNKNKLYINEVKRLNKLDCIDYEKVLNLKGRYITDLFAEIGTKTLNESESFKTFYKHNAAWLFPYACFCALRDKHKSVDIQDWGSFSKYNEEELKLYIKEKGLQDELNKIYFTQYLLDDQLSRAKQYAYKNGIVLKGDIPIGISRNSVDAWTEPHLFNIDTQTGAPPDDFSTEGQNWGFPTYNWTEMAKDGYQWWIQRFRKMSDYFDAYRIDHILGFFRIWEIPTTSIHGLLGYFNPALPLTKKEIEDKGVKFDESEMTVASIHTDDINKYGGEVIIPYLDKKDSFRYVLKEAYDNQYKISVKVRDIDIQTNLYRICNEVLFVRDKYDISKYHPRIAVHQTNMYKRLNEGDRDSLSKLYEDYFYNRHSQLWRQEAIKKLPTLINSTDMLVCGEDLGMVPDSVPSVMKDLEILSLEIERMPKRMGAKFENLAEAPYLSVITTSTHDMSPVRMWWKENQQSSQHYYNGILERVGNAPLDCDASICMQIVENHLKSPAMLSIFPLQDWLSIDEKLRRPNPNEERINVPAESQHNWKYRMHIWLEDLIRETGYNNKVYELNKRNGR